MKRPALAALLIAGAAFAQAPHGGTSGGGSASGGNFFDGGITFHDGTGLTTGRFNSVVDANTLLYYKMNGATAASGETDFGTDALNLLAQGVGPAPTYGSEGTNSTARAFAWDAGVYSSADIGALSAQLTTGAYTIEIWFRPYAYNFGGGESTLFQVTGSRSSNKDMMLVGIDFQETTANGHLQQVNMFWFSTNSVDVDYYVPYTFSFNQWNFVAVTSTAPSGGNVTKQTFAQGVPADLGQVVSAPVQSPDAGEGLLIGGCCGTQPGVPTNQFFPGDIGMVKVESGVMTPAQIQADYLHTRP